jgi:hypothetical protein
MCFMWFFFQRWVVRFEGEDNVYNPRKFITRGNNNIVYLNLTHIQNNH